MKKNQNKPSIPGLSGQLSEGNIPEGSFTLQRRGFLKTMGLLGGSTLLGQSALTSENNTRVTPEEITFKSKLEDYKFPSPLDLSPAKWIWYPGDRTLPNTFVLFRRVLNLQEKPVKATGWVIGDSRYLLELNGNRVQWGPVPNDPRWPEVDPVDMTDVLTTGENIIGATVLYFGQGDATWPMGRPGFIFLLELEFAGGRKELVVSDGAWRCHLSQAWKPGHHRMFYMRALQEEFDARIHPQGWNRQGFVEDQEWIEPFFPPCPANLPIFADPTYEHFYGMHGPRKYLYGAESRSKLELRPRSIPLMRESWVSAAPLVEQHRIKWKRPIDVYFAMRPPNTHDAEVTQVAQPAGENAWRLELDPGRGTTLTFALPEQVVGWPSVTIEAPVGTTLEIMTQDGHAVGGPALLNTSHHKWARYICQEGANHFRWFDFDCFRWMQVHLHPGRGTVIVSNPGVLKREYPWPNEPRVITSEVPLQRVFDAATNTMRNMAQETFVDGMSRERSQYAGFDISLCRYAIHMLVGDNRQVARYLTSYSQGITSEGYFMTKWPSHDDLMRLGQRVVEATHVGAVLDAGVDFATDCWEYYLYTGDPAPLREPYPRLLRLVKYLTRKIGEDNLLSVEQEDYGFPIVYMGFIGNYPEQRHRKCVFNLLVVHMFNQVMAPMCRLFGDDKPAEQIEQTGLRILDATIARFWSPEHGAFVDNLPWWKEEGGVRFSEVTLGRSVIWDLCPGGDIQRSVELLATRVLSTRPKNVGYDLFPGLVAWPWWALAKGGRTDVVLKEMRERFATMPSVLLNNSIEEYDGQSKNPDKPTNWSHCCSAPIYVAVMSLAGIRPLEPAFNRYEIRPQLADLPDLAMTVHTPHGPIVFSGKGPLGKRTLILNLPPDAAGELVVHPDEKLELKSLGKGRFSLPAGKAITLSLKYT
jgi:alpha-L-rhamnosidase